MPPKEDGSKQPEGEWKQYQIARPSAEKVRNWYSNGRLGIGFICGKVSGDLTVFEFDDYSVYEQYKRHASECGLSSLVDKIEAGYVERTPGGGIHWPYYCSQIFGNTKLARRPKRPEEMIDPNDKVKVLIETRGEGGFIVVAPSGGKVHPSGRSYELLQGSLKTIAHITPEEQELLWELARSFDELPKAQATEERKGKAPEGGRPGDVFNATALWEDTGLYDQGWKRTYSHGGTTYLMRPGKRMGISASINHNGSDLFYCFSTSTDFESERGYSKFSVYTHLNHAGNYSAAASSLLKLGYGATHPDSTVAHEKQAPTPDPIPITRDTAIPGLVRLSDVEPEMVEWLWPGRIPLGKLTILDGDPGLGKSMVTCDIAARVSTGREMPDGTFGDLDGPVGVVLLSAEDGLADTIRPRLNAAGADCTRIAALTHVVEKETGLMKAPSVADLHEIEVAIFATEAKLVIIDPVVAYLPEKTKSHNDQDVRRVLAPLAQLAERNHVAIWLLRHLNKAPGGNPLYRGGGSIAFIGAVRSGLIAAQDPEDDTGERRIIASTKSNLARAAQALAYHVETAENGAARIVWEGMSDQTASSLLTSIDPDEKSQLAEAVEFLRDLLLDGEVKSTEVQARSKAAGVSFTTLKRAKIKLKVKAERRGMITDAHWVWVMPEKDEQYQEDH